MRVIGIDPGSRKLGWGIVERRGARNVHIAHGTIDTKDGETLGERLVIIANELEEVLAMHAPNAASVESIFFAKDAQAASKLGHARGVALLCCAKVSVEIFEYPPARVKATVTGSGKADKRAVGMMMQRILSLKELPQVDAADALAIALTHLLGPNSRQFKEARKKGTDSAV